MMASSMGRARPSGVVWEVAGSTAKRWVHGESEGRREATGHGGVLSRPGTSSCASWRGTGRLWACLGALVLASVVVILVNGVHGRGQRGEGKLQDMMWLS
jgi:hypothetical protein